MARGAFLEDLTWDEASGRIKSGAIVLIPVGAVAKEHGTHLPLNTDWLVVRELARRVAGRLPAIVAPVVGFGYYPAFAGYPGSQHLRVETFIALVNDLVGNFIGQGAEKIVILNNGVSTEAPLELVARGIFESHGARIAVANTRELGRVADKLLAQESGGHADERETSVMLAIAPEAVRMEKARPTLRRPAAVGLWRSPVTFSLDPASPDYNPTGATGDPTLATAAKGEAILAAMVRELVEGLRARWPELPTDREE
jgi:creatinine amidohydrolase